MTDEKRPPLLADVLEAWQKLTRDQKQTPNPTRRRQPKVARMQSRRMRTASSQTINPVKAIYGPESKWNETPLAPNRFVGTRNVGPSDMDRNGFSPAKSTVSTNGGGYPKNRQSRGRGTTGTGRRTAADWDKLADQYDI